MRCEVFTTSLTFLLFMSTDQEGAQIIGDSICYRWSGVALWPGQYLVLLTLRHAQICLLTSNGQKCRMISGITNLPCPPTRRSLCPSHLVWKKVEGKITDSTHCCHLLGSLLNLFSGLTKRIHRCNLRPSTLWPELAQITPQYSVLSNVETCTDMSPYSEWAEIS